MEASSPGHLLVILVIIVSLFGGKRIPGLMRGMDEGVRAFEEGLRSEEKPAENKTAEEERVDLTSSKVAVRCQVDAGRDEA